MRSTRATTASAAAVAAAAGLLSSCAGTVSDAYVIEDDPGHVEHVEGSDLGVVTLTEAAASRLRIRTAAVGRRGGNLTVPSTAVLVDPMGVWWVYTNPEPHRFVRHEIEVVREANGRAVLSAGPEAGTRVAVVGVAELYGVETEVGH